MTIVTTVDYCKPIVYCRRPVTCKTNGTGNQLTTLNIKVVIVMLINFFFLFLQVNKLYSGLLSLIIQLGKENPYGIIFCSIKCYWLPF